MTTVDWMMRNVMITAGGVGSCVPFLQKHPSPEDWLFKEARGLFLNPDVVDASTVELKWCEPDEDGLIQFMCNEKQFRYVDLGEEIIVSKLSEHQIKLCTFLILGF